MEARKTLILKDIESESAAIVSNCFCKSLWLMQAIEALKKVKEPCSEGLWRSRVLVQNADIELRIATGVSLPAGVLSRIQQLDLVIANGAKLNRSQSFDEFSAYAKALLFTRFGDCLLLNIPVKDERGRIRADDQKRLAFAAYSIALDSLLRLSPSSSALIAAHSMDILILRTLLSYDDNPSSTALLCDDKQLGARMYRICYGVSSLTGCPSVFRSLQPLSRNIENFSVNMELHMSKIWPILFSGNSLHRLMWLFTFSNEVASSPLSFIDAGLSGLPETPEGDDLLLFSSESSLTRLDVKVLLVASARWSALNAQRSTRSLCPAVTYPHANHWLTKFWSFIGRMRDSTQKLNAAASAFLGVALEISRLRGSIPDVRIVETVWRWLIKNGDSQGNWALHYARTLISLDDRSAVMGLGKKTGFFPNLSQSIAASEEQKIVEDASRWLNDRLLFPDRIAGHESAVIKEEVVDVSDAQQNLNKKGEAMVQAASSASSQNGESLLTRVSRAFDQLVATRKATGDPFILRRSPDDGTSLQEQFNKKNKRADELLRKLALDSECSPLKSTNKPEPFMVTLLEEEQRHNREMERLMETAMKRLAIAPKAEGPSPDVAELQKASYYMGFREGYLYHDQLGAMGAVPPHGTPRFPPPPPPPPVNSSPVAPMLRQARFPVAPTQVVNSSLWARPSTGIQNASPVHASVMPTGITATAGSSKVGPSGVSFVPTTCAANAANIAIAPAKVVSDSVYIAPAMKNNTQTLQAANGGSPHDPRKCVGCASDQVQERILRELDRLADASIL